MARKGVSRAKSSTGNSVWPAEERPFVGEIHAHPFDDAPRLIFADWLEERGDPRAEFIRVQCQLANLRVRDPQYAALTAREQKLIARRQACWLQPYPELKGLKWGIDGEMYWSFDGPRMRHHFTRGFAEAAHVKNFDSFLELGATLVDELGIRELQLPVSSGRIAQTIAVMPQLARLGAVIYSGASDLTPILTAPKLGPLWRLDVVDFRSIAKGLKTFLAGPASARLRWLNVGRVSNAEDLRPLVQWKHAEQLDTLVIDPDDEEGEIIQMLCEAPLSLSQFKLRAFNLGPPELLAACQQIAASPAFASLTSLRIFGIDPGGSRDFYVQLPLPPRVTTLGLSFLNDAEVSVLALAKSSCLQQVRRLSIAGDVLGDPAAISLARSKALGNLESLELTVGQFTEKGVAALVRSETLGKLEHLRLEATFLEKDARAELKKEFRGRLEI